MAMHIGIAAWKRWRFMNADRTVLRLPRAALLWILACSAGALLLHVDRLPLWVTLVAVGCGLWRYALENPRLHMPGAWLRAVMALTLLSAVVAQFHAFSGLAAGSALLTCMAAVKLLETRTRRDALTVIATSLFLMLSACLDRQSLMRAPLYMAETWLACATLGVLSAPQANWQPWSALKLAGRTLLLGVPVSLLLFLFFPRIQGQVWALPSGSSARTGLSDEMSPGAISQLSESDEPAFRVRFLGNVPPSQSMYWRGPVLHTFDGYTWRRDRLVNYRSARLDYLGAPFAYRVTLEPHQRNWWFALDTPVAAPNGSVVLTFDYQLLASQPVTQTISYELTSHLQTVSGDAVSTLARRYDTQLPPGRNPRSVALAQTLRRQAGDDQALINLILDRFRDGGYEYTLTPPLLDLDSIDDFLFNTRRGFCGHFASAFVMLMRAAGVPARVVTGYQGGEWNPIGSYFLVKQSDAHAWAEVWLDGRGWTRVDPTAVVAPDRLLRASTGSFAGGTGASELLASLGWITRARLGWDALNTWWQGSVLDFDLRSQLGLLEKIGFDSPSLRQLGWLLAAGMTLWLAWLALRFGRNFRPARGDAVARGYRRIGRALARAASTRAPHEGPVAFAERLAREAPLATADLRPLLFDYAQLRFGANSSEADRRCFIQRTHWWRLLRRRRRAAH